MQLDPTEDILLPLESLLDALQLCLDAVQDAGMFEFLHRGF